MEPSNQTAFAQWRVWRGILDRIIANPHYRYDDPRKWPYLKLARFASDQMAIFNTKAWRG